jgi:hypothetical protein
MMRGISWIYKNKSGPNDRNNQHDLQRQQLFNETFNESDEDGESVYENNRNKDNNQQHNEIGSVGSDITTPSCIRTTQNGSDARIIAPNVSKLSPHSAVEVRVESGNQCVAVLCSVDVLKMRSGFFHDVLCEQEANFEMKSDGGPTATSANPNILWRDSIIVPDESPFEAAAFLESLHEGRALFRGEWNFCWARLRYDVLTDTPYTILVVLKYTNTMVLKCALGHRGHDAGICSSSRRTHG